MAEGKALKFDPNTEAFQMRAQLKKAENCKKQWHERWSWLLDEEKVVRDHMDSIRQEAAATLPQASARELAGKSLKPVPVTSTGFIGWLATKPECQLEIYTSWLTKPPIRLPDAWSYPGYEGKKD